MSNTSNNSLPVGAAQPVAIAPHASGQPPFFGQLLLGVSRQWRRILDAHLAQLGLTDAIWVPLFHLHEQGQPLTLKALAQRVGLESSTLVRVVDLLEARGWVVRTTDVHDRRSKLLRMTEAGCAAVAEVHAALQRIEAHMLQDMQPQLVATLQDGMAQLAQRLAAAGEGPQHDPCSAHALSAAALSASPSDGSSALASAPAEGQA